MKEDNKYKKKNSPPFLLTSNIPFWLSKLGTRYILSFCFPCSLSNDDHCCLEEPNLFLWQEYENYIVFWGLDINFSLA